MALLRASVYLYAASITHIIIAYFLIFNPQVFETQTHLTIIGEAMGLPKTTNLGHVNSRSASALLGAVFAFIGISDFIATGMDEIPYRVYWGSQAPVRLIFFFLLIGYTYIFRPTGSALYSTTAVGPGLEALKSGLVFSWGLAEVITWFWIYSTLREELGGAIAKQRAKADNDD